MRTTSILSCILGLSLALVACGDDDTTTTTTSGTSTTASTTSGMGGNSSTTSGMGGTTSSMGGNSGGPSQACIDGCNALWTCTQEGDLCPGLKGGDADAEKAFKDGCTANPLCEGSASIVAGKMCPDMVATISGLSADFKDACAGTMGGGGAGGN